MKEEKFQTDSSSTEFLQKFTYRPFEGKFEPRWKRVLYLMRFELISTWRKSKFARLLMTITFVFSFFTIIITALIPFGNVVAMRDALNESVASYLSLSPLITPSSGGISISVGSLTGLGILLIMVIGLAGSGFFADDKQGKVIEIYLSRLSKREYVIGKVGAIVLYINLLVLLPLFLKGLLFVQALGENQLNYLDYYLGMISYCILISIIIGLFILVLSIFVEKRSYASLIFFIFFVFGSIIGEMIRIGIPNSEILLLISPSNFLVLLAYVCLGDYDLGVGGGIFTSVELNLNNGVGLEYWHVFLVAFIIILILTLTLVYKIRKTTTEEL
ncbi:hypothetical protein LCGC14_0937690 [marine sediment metagenome]|uniref:ABC-2 type transporter domain-containing protein n=1 Tax=marine sediment metagenome TaxID=412755 RepID=A0A0F9R4M0_9ZZZZ